MTQPPPGHPFDVAAETYDRSFTETRLGREYRGSVWRELATTFRTGDRVLELGCGTGEDTVWLAQRGIAVVATDASPVMLEVTRNKTTRAGVGDLVTTRTLDLTRIGEEANGLDGPFDGALSNFGPLNCLPDRTALARTLAQLVRPGARLVAVLMGRYCAWEVAWHLGHGQPRTALRRLRSGAAVRVRGDRSIAVWYPSPRRIRREFAPDFQPRSLTAIGCFLPPPYLDHLTTTWPRLLDLLARLDERFRHIFPFTWLGDHFLVSLERRDTGGERPGIVRRRRGSGSVEWPAAGEQRRGDRRPA